MSAMDHIEALKAKHASLEDAIHREVVRPLPSDEALCNLKKKKLKIKDEIDRFTSYRPR